MCVVIVVIKATATYLLCYFHAESAKINIKNVAINSYHLCNTSI